MCCSFQYWAWATATVGLSVTPACSSSPSAVSIIGRRCERSPGLVLISAAITICCSVTTAWRCSPGFMAANEPGDGRVIRHLVTGNHPESNMFPALPLNPARGPLAGAAQRHDNLSEMWAWLGSYEVAHSYVSELFDDAQLAAMPILVEHTVDALNALMGTMSFWARLSPQQRDASRRREPRPPRAARPADPVEHRRLLGNGAADAAHLTAPRHRGPCASAGRPSAEPTIALALERPQCPRALRRRSDDRDRAESAGASCDRFCAGRGARSAARAIASVACWPARIGPAASACTTSPPAARGLSLRTGVGASPAQERKAGGRLPG